MKTLTTYTVMIVEARRIEVRRVTRTYSASGTPWDRVDGRSQYPDWPTLLQKRKPWVQDGPIKIVRLNIGGRPASVV